MSLSPNPLETVARARHDLRLGLPIVIGNTLICAAETISPDRLATLRACGAVLAITARRADVLKAHAYDGRFARIAVPAEMGIDWVRQVADPSLDLNAPMKGPFRSMRDNNAGHAGLAFDLLKAAMLLPAAMVYDLETCPTDVNITRLDPAWLTDVPTHLNRIAAAKVPLRAYKETRLHVFRPDDGGEEHYAIEIGNPDRSAPVLTRLHSACFTGDLLGSLKCDCGPQLNGALDMMGQHKAGVLLYLNQEGRGIGLANKMRAYALQDQGFDTVQANHRLGFEDDERDFRIGATILRDLGVSQVRLLTNNPAKVDMLALHGITVAERVPLQVGETAQNRGYLAVKAAKSGHIL